MYTILLFSQTETPEREIYRDPDVVRAEEIIDDSKIAKESHTASKMLNKFRQMEENMSREPEPAGKIIHLQTRTSKRSKSPKKAGCY